MESINKNHRHVIKRNNTKQRIYYDKITKRLENLLDDNEKNSIDCTIITEKILTNIHDGITTEELDLEAANICYNLCTTSQVFSDLASRILVSNLHKKNKKTFSEKTDYVYNIYLENPMLDENYYNYVMENAKVLDDMIDYSYDYKFKYIGFKTIEKLYLIKDKDGSVLETPQDLFLRVAVFLNIGDLDMIKKTFNTFRNHEYIHASPTLFNSGMKRSQLASCFLIGTGDSIEDITKTWSDVASISKNGGGIGIHISNVRSSGSLIKSTNGHSKGIIPMLKVYNEICRYVDQSGKRKGSFAFYLEPHHPDLMEFLELKKNFGDESVRTRDLFLALWISDLFMKQVESNGSWYFMCPSKCPKLNEVYGEEYEKLYWKYVEEKKYNFVKPAQEVMKAIMESQIETGSPYIAFKDHINKKSNQSNLGTIKSSNLCIEIMQYSDKDEYATCNLASIPINNFLIKFKQEKEFNIYTKEDCRYCKWAKNFMKNSNYQFNEIEDNDGSLIRNHYLMKDNDKITFPQIFYGDEYVGGFNELIKFTKDSYNYKKLEETAYLATINLNNVIDINYYPCIETKKSNLKHRPIGLGIQGVADTLNRLRIPFESPEAIKFNEMFMESIYKGGIRASLDLSKKRYEMVKYIKENIKIDEIPLYYDKNIKFNESKFNSYYHELKLNKCELSLNYAFGSYSSFENSKASQGILQFDMWNKIPNDIEFWNSIKDEIKKYGLRNSLITALMPTASTSKIMGNCECFEPFTNNINTTGTLAGDFVNINKYLLDDMMKIEFWNNDIKDFIISENGSIQKLNLPKIFKDLYKTIWEIKQVNILKCALARSPYVDQSQSMNIYMGIPNFKKLYSCHFWSWKNGLKTGVYYLHSAPSSDATKFSIDYNISKKLDDECLLCSA